MAPVVPMTAWPPKVLPAPMVTPPVTAMGLVPVVPRTTLAPDCRLRPPAKEPVMVSTPVGPVEAPRTFSMPAVLLVVKPAVPKVGAEASCWMERLPPFSEMLRPPRIWLATGVTRSVPASISYAEKIASATTPWFASKVPKPVLMNLMVPAVPVSEALKVAGEPAATLTAKEPALRAIGAKALKRESISRLPAVEPEPTAKVRPKTSSEANDWLVKPARPGPTKVKVEPPPSTVPTKLVLTAWLMVTAPPVPKSSTEPAEPLTPTIVASPLRWSVMASPKVMAAKAGADVR